MHASTVCTFTLSPFYIILSGLRLVHTCWAKACWDLVQINTRTHEPGTAELQTHTQTMILHRITSALQDSHSEPSSAHPACAQQRHQDVCEIDTGEETAGQIIPANYTISQCNDVLAHGSRKLESNWLSAEGGRAPPVCTSLSASTEADKLTSTTERKLKPHFKKSAKKIISREEKESTRETIKDSMAVHVQGVGSSTWCEKYRRGYSRIKLHRSCLDSDADHAPTSDVQLWNPSCIFESGHHMIYRIGC